VSYGANGKVVPALAQSWTVAPNTIGGDTYTFTLRQGVSFHDGADWNCTVAKMNFDHIFAGSLATEKHGWYGVGKYTNDWSCGTNDFEFVVNTNFKHGPYLQELTLIRPVRMISPNAFPSSDGGGGGGGDDPIGANSCHLDWGTVDHTNTEVEAKESVTCVGITDIAGTGPFEFLSKDTADGSDDRVTFVSNEDYWGGAPAIKTLEIVRYATSAEVKNALMKEELDIVWGSGVLSDSDIVEIQNDASLQGTIGVFHSDAIQNVILLLNSGNPPFDDINVRKTVIHAINKSRIVTEELQGLQTVVDNVFPVTASYCDVDLTPTWDYDFEKSVLLSCGGLAGQNSGNTNSNGGVVSSSSGSENDSSSSASALALGLGIGLGLLFVVMSIVAYSLYKKKQDLEQELDVVLRKNGGGVDA